MMTTRHNNPRRDLVRGHVQFHNIFAPARQAPIRAPAENLKLDVDIVGYGLYLQFIDICLLSFGYRASGTAPLNEPSFQKSLSPSAVLGTAVVQ
jgi:hypothetical protein